MEHLLVKVRAVTSESPTIKRIELVTAGDIALPQFTAGSHIVLELGNGLQRSYSLMNSPRDIDRYEIAVALAQESRGGSKYCHEAIKVGDSLRTTVPRNAFPIKEADVPVVLIAGGIGITPLLAMAHELQQTGRPWELVYAARTRKDLVFGEILQSFGGRVLLHADEACGGPPDLKKIVASALPRSHFYCCGPAPMLQSFRAATAEIEPDRSFTESFAGSEAAADVGGFHIELAKSGITIEVPLGNTILDVLRAHGVVVPSSCEQGVCGVCETRVIAGTPDHRDMVLSEGERASNETMMICCSGAKSKKLILDL